MSKFHDEFLNKGSPDHDKLMIQCTSKDGISRLIEAIDVDNYITGACLKNLLVRDYRNTIASYSAPIMTRRYETEVIVKNGTFIIGYADAVITLNLSGPIQFTDDSSSTYKVTMYILIEAKPTVSSIGEVIRQLKTYKSMLYPYELMLPVIVTYTQLDADALAYLKNEGIRVVVFPRP